MMDIISYSQPQLRTNTESTITSSSKDSVFKVHKPCIYLFFLHLLIYFVYRVCVHTCHKKCVEVKGQLAGVGLLLQLWSSGGGTQVLGLGHLAAPASAWGDLTKHIMCFPVKSRHWEWTAPANLTNTTAVGCFTLLGSPAPALTWITWCLSFLWMPGLS